MNQVGQAAKTGLLASLFVASAGFVGGTILATVGKLIWIWCNWLWNLY